MVDGFKDTDVGLVPNDWNVKNLSDIGESIIGLTYSPANVKPYGKLVLRSSNVQNGKLAFDNNVFVEMDFPPRVIVKENDILICVRNGSRQLIGKCALIDKKTAGSAFGAFMSVYRSEFSTFIFHQFRSNIIQRQINETLGATINQITNKDLASFKVPLPPTKAEQTAIATALNDADALITQLEKFIAKKRAIKQGAMQELLKPKNGWKVFDFKNIFRKLNAKRQQRQQIQTKEYQQSGKYPVIDQGKQKVVAYSDNSSKVFSCPNDGLIVFGDHTREIKFVDYDFIVGADGTQLITVNKEHSIKFFFYQLLLKEVPNTGYNRHFKFLLEMEFIIPDKTEQTRIAQILSDMDADIEALEKKLEKYKMIKQGMMQNLLTGRIRLI